MGHRLAPCAEGQQFVDRCRDEVLVPGSGHDRSFNFRGRASSADIVASSDRWVTITLFSFVCSAVAADRFGTACALQCAIDMIGPGVNPLSLPLQGDHT